jgi:hypothetical protein
MKRARWLVSPAGRDCLFLTGAVALSFASYAQHLGFYSDDWAFLGRYATALDQTLNGLVRASISDLIAMRPVQVWLFAGLYRLFGMEPLGYHLFNGVLLVASALLLYAITRELRVARTIGLPVALVYSLLPNYSTDRYWYAAFMITLSMTTCFASIAADLKAVTAPPRECVGWKVLSVAALLVSALAYEVALPVFLIVPFLMLWRMWREDPRLPRRRLVQAAVLILINIALLTGVGAFKLRATVRLGAQQGLRAQIADIARLAARRNLPYGHYGLNVYSAVRVHFGDYGLKLPASAEAVGRTAPSAVLWLTVAFGLLAFAYLVGALRDDPWPSLAEWSALVPLGLIVFGLGYAIFLTNYNVQFTPTGIANRTAIAATLGAALVIVGSCGLLVVWLPARRLVRLTFTALIAAVATCGFLVINSVAAQWVAAYGVERRVLSGIRRQFPLLPPNSTLILDGVCPYIGPAIVFESYWDLAGALQALYREETLSADVATAHLVVGDEGVITSIYGLRKTYPYSTTLLLYNAGSGVTRPLTDPATARAYFEEPMNELSCPRGQEGVGVRLF